MTLPPLAAGLFLLAALPIGFFVAYSDLSRMKIPNIANYALVVAFAVFGLISLPFMDYLWQWSHVFIMLVIGIILNAAGVMGAGDAKFIAAASPMVPLADATNLVPIVTICFLSGYAAHRIAKHSPIRKMVPHWESWQAGRRFPMGFPLAMILNTYLVLSLLQGLQSL